MGFLLLVFSALFGMQERKNGGPERAPVRKEKKRVHWADGVPAWRTIVRESSAGAGEIELCDKLSELAFVRKCEVRKNVYRCLLCHKFFNDATQLVTHVGYHAADDIVKLVHP